MLICYLWKMFARFTIENINELTDTINSTNLILFTFYWSNAGCFFSCFAYLFIARGRLRVKIVLKRNSWWKYFLRGKLMIAHCLYTRKKQLNFSLFQFLFAHWNDRFQGKYKNTRKTFQYSQKQCNSIFQNTHVSIHKYYLL